MRKDRMKIKEYSAGSTVLTVAFVLICLVWIMPIYEVVVNSLKSTYSLTGTASSFIFTAKNICAFIFVMFANKYYEKLMFSPASSEPSHGSR